MIKHEFTDKTELDNALADAIQSKLNNAITSRGKAAIAFSGGSTPKGLFQCLREREIDWSKVSVTLVDDRWVPEDHQASNAGLLKQYLLPAGFHQQFVPLVINAEKDNAFESAEDINRQLETQLPFLDIAILGMGTDGHTASFFPGSPQLAQALDVNNAHRCIATQPTNAEFDRMTLTLAFLLTAKSLILHITGKEKQLILDDVIDSPESTQYPVSAVIHQQRAPTDIYYAD